MKHRAFTLIELVFVIVIIGILSTIIVSYAKPNDNPAYVDGLNNYHQATGRYAEAAAQLMSHLRYTQHLAMSDNQQKLNDNTWFIKRWQLKFAKRTETNNLLTYSVFTDITKSGSPEVTSTIIEVAKDPVDNSKYLSGGYDTAALSTDLLNSKLNLGKSYGIEDVKFTDGCSYYGSTTISFDQFGRPYKGSTRTLTDSFQKNRIIRTTCKIKLCSEENCNNHADGTSSKLVVILVEPETGYVHLSTNKDDIAKK